MVSILRIGIRMVFGGTEIQKFIICKNFNAKFIKYRLQNLIFGNKIKLGKYEKINTSHTEKGGVNMATSSITKNFIISGQKQVEMFADAIEASANDRTPRVPINVTYLQGTDYILKFMERRKKADATSK